MELTKKRVNWVDYSKGICIILVVGMHSTLGVENAAGGLSWLHGFIEWAKPFRMPDFFLLSGLFLSSRINKPWRQFLDSKVLHFCYFYLLWMTIVVAMHGVELYHIGGVSNIAKEWLYELYEPASTLWFIYILVIFFLVTRTLKSVPPQLMFLGAALLEISSKTGLIDTGHTLIDEFAARYVYFYTGYWLSARVFKMAARVDTAPVPMIISGLLAWATFNFAMVWANLANQPGISLWMGFIGAFAVISTGVLLSKFRFADALRYCGQNSIIIYLSFVVFMAAVRVALLRLTPGLGLTAISLIDSTIGVIGPLLLWWGTRGTKLDFLFRRPQWARLNLQKAEVAQTGSQWHSVQHVTRPLHQP